MQELYEKGELNPQEIKWNDNGEIQKLQQARVREANARLISYIQSKSADEDEHRRLVNYFVFKYYSYVGLLADNALQKEDLG